MNKLFKNYYRRITAFLILELFIIANALPVFSNVQKKHNNSIPLVSLKQYVNIEEKNISENDNKKNTSIEKNIKNITKEKSLFAIKEMKNAQVINSNKAYVTGADPVIIKYKDVKLEIPKGAIKEPVEIIIEELKEINNLNPGMDNVTGKILGYRFLPDGMKFEKNILLSLPYDKTKVISESDFSSLTSFFYNEELHKWEKLQRVSIDKENGLVSSLTDHFTDIINSTLKLPESDGPMSFNPTSIKDMKSANPFSGIPQFSGLDANSRGSANFNIPIKLPPGRNGMMPGVSINYNSDCGNGWLGKGFNFSIPFITINTKFGLPNYDGNDNYLFNGSELIEDKINGNETTYKLRIENMFAQIIRKGSSPADYIFEVTTKNGTKSIYGSDEAKIGHENGIYIWYLKSVTDLNGNTIIYNYQSNSADDNYIYLSQIDYTGHTTEGNGDYHIIFNNEDREDVIINCRGKFRSEMNQRLAEIKILFKTNLIRSYELRYRSNTESNFGKSEIQEIAELDKNGQEFYSYKFEYHDMPLVDDNYDGFTQAVKWENADEMSRSKQSDSGATFYGGVGLYHSAFTVGVEGDVNQGKSINKKELIDIDGDRLPDLVSKDSRTGRIKYKKNTGYGFETTEQNFEGLEDYMNTSGSNGNSYSIKGGIGPFGVNRMKRKSHTEAYTLLSDVNGDGYVDVIVQNADYYYKNMLYEGEAKFEIAYWGGEGVLEPGVQEDDNSEIEEAFYLLDPIIKWKPYHSGTVTIVNNDIINNGNDENNKSDGVKLNLYKNDESLWNGMSSKNNDWIDEYDENILATSIFLKEGDVFSSSDDQNTINHINIDKNNDNIYFRVNSIKKIADDEVTWNPVIFYENIRLHDDMSDYLYKLPDRIYISTKNTFLAGVSLISCYNSPNQNNGIDYYSLKSDISEIDEENLKKNMFDNKFFLPNHISIEDVDNIMSNLNITIEEKNMFLKYYQLNSTKYRFDLRNGSTLEEKNLIRNVFKKSAFDNNKYYYYQYLNVDYIVGQNENNELFINMPKDRVIENTVMTEDEFQNADNIGDYSENCIIVDKKEIDGITYLTKFYTDIPYSLTVSDNLGNENSFTIASEELEIDEDGNLIEITLNLGEDYNVKKYLLEKTDDAPDKIPVKIYHDIFLNEIPSVLTSEEYDEAILINQALIETVYYEDNTQYKLGEINFEQAFQLLDLFAQIDSYALYYRLDSENNFFVMENNLTIEQLDYLKTVFSELNNFIKYSKIIQIKDNRNYDVDLSDHGPDMEELEVAFKLYENEKNNSQSTVVQLEYMDVNGITRETSQYLHVFNLSTDFTLVNLNKIPDSIPIPETDESDLNSDEKDFDQTLINEKLMELEPFNGGVYGWFFGEWNGNIDNWSVAKIKEQSNSNLNNTDDILDDTVEKEYGINFTAMDFRNAGSEFNVSNNSSEIDVSEIASLIEDHPVYSKGLWHGTEYIYVEEVPSDKEGQDFDKVACYYTSYIMGATICPSRKGGDSIEKIPNKNGSIPLDKINDIRYSKEEGISWSVGIGAMSTSYYEGDTYGQKDFMDINGDGYPDQLISNGDKLTAIICKKIKKDGITKIGFTGKKDITNANSSIRHTIGEVSSIGASGGSGGTSFSLKFGPSGNPTNIKLNFPAVAMSRSTTDGKTNTTTDLFDINGDGLLDHVKKTDTSGFLVKLNCGDYFEDEELWETPGMAGNSVFDKCTDVRQNQIRNASENSSASIGQEYVSAGLSYTNDSLSENFTIVDITDINGDGLIDYIYSYADPDDDHDDDDDDITDEEECIYVSINKGNGFLAPKIWNKYTNWDTSASAANEYLTDEKIAELMETGKTTLTFTTADLKSTDFDVIRTSLYDSLFDICDPEDSPKALSYNFTQCGGFTNPAFNITFGVNLYFSVFLVTIVISLKPTLNFSNSESVSPLKLIDINGDGAPDHVYRKDDQNYLRVKFNNSPGSGLLKSIISPTGSTTTLEYERTGNTDEMPQNKFVLSEVNSYDGWEKDEFNNPKINTVKYEYFSGKYDREEREFYGFSIVKEISEGAVELDGDDIIIQREYYNDFYRKGLLNTETYMDSSGNIWSFKTFTYDDTPILDDSEYIEGVHYIPLNEISIVEYDEFGNELSTSQNFNYDKYGNVISYIDQGNQDSGDEIYVDIEYKYDLNNKYLIKNPEYMVVKDSNNNILRERKAEYHDITGNLSTHYRTINDSVNHIFEDTITSYTYDKYGNTKSVICPGGYTIYYNIDYNYSLDSYKITTLDSAGYSSEVIIDYCLGSDISITDVGGSTMNKEYDTFGRLIKVWTDYDIYQSGSLDTTESGMSSANHAVEYVYYHSEFPARAVTKNKIYHDPLNTDCLNTVVITDGFGRVIQTKKEGVIHSEDLDTTIYGMNVSGKVIYDKVGRVVQKGQPVFQPGGYNEFYYESGEILRPTKFHYNANGKINSVVYPDGSTISMNYVIEDNLFKIFSIDPNGQKTINYKNIKNQIVKEEKYYRELNDVKKYSEVNLSDEWKTFTTSYEYSEIGELLKISDSTNTISFTYDTLGRCTSINDANNGLVINTYDNNGNIIYKQNNKMIDLSQKIEYQYDACNRLIKTIYPNMPDVTYTYADSESDNYQRGKLIKIEDQSGVTEFVYGKLGEKTEIIKNLKCTAFPEGREYSIGYQYDYLGQITSINYPVVYDTSANPPYIREGETIFYEYDQAGQVNKVYGFFNDINETVNYVDIIHYDEFGRRKYIKYGNGVETEYNYDENREWLTNLTTSIEKYSGIRQEYQNINYNFDKVGNILNVTNDTVNSFGRKISQSYFYDDLYQLVFAEGSYEKPSIGYTNNYKQLFEYNDLGNMLNKTSQQMDNNGEYRDNLNYNLNYEYNNEKPFQVKKIGDINYEYDSNGNLKRKFISNENAENIQKEIESVNDDENSADIAYGFNWNKTENGDYLISEYEWDDENRLIKTVTNSDTVNFVYNAAGDRVIKQVEKKSETLYVDNMYQVETQSLKMVITKHIFIGNARIATKVTYEDLDNNSNTEKLNTFFYHQDHLGGTNVITDYNGDYYEYFEYTPFGESWVEEGDYRDTNFITHRFTGKELDEETGLYYYGQRYYDPQTSKWLTCDPERQHMNPYMYCRNNPLKYIDPDGNADINPWDDTSVMANARNTHQGKTGGRKIIKDVQKYIETGTSVLMFEFPELKPFGKKRLFGSWTERRVIDIIFNDYFKDFSESAASKSLSSTLGFYGMTIFKGTVIAGIVAGYLIAFYQMLPDGAKSFLGNLKDGDIGMESYEYDGNGKVKSSRVTTIGGSEIFSDVYATYEINDKKKIGSGVGLSLSISATKGLNYHYSFNGDTSTNVNVGADYSGVHIGGEIDFSEKTNTVTNNSKYSGTVTYGWDGKLSINLSIDWTVSSPANKSDNK